jgi:hypothetical protein
MIFRGNHSLLTNPASLLYFYQKYNLMIRGFFIAILTTFSLYLAGQTYHPLVTSGKTWSAAHSYGQPFPWFSDYIKFGEDTVINALIYKKVWKSQDSVLYGWTANGFIREDQQAVYYLSWAGGPPNHLLYDFNLNTGDTVYLFSDPMGIWFKVDSTGNFPLLSGEVRRKIALSCYTGNTVVGHDTWIEGIGSLYGVLGSGSCALVGDDPRLLCCHENDTLKYIDPFYNTCHLITDTQGPTDNNDIAKVFVNEHKQVIVKIGDTKLLPVHFRMIDLNGKILLNKMCKDPVTTFSSAILPGNSWVFYIITGQSKKITGRFLNN